MHLMVRAFWLLAVGVPVHEVYGTVRRRDHVLPVHQKPHQFRAKSAVLHSKGSAILHVLIFEGVQNSTPWCSEWRPNAS